MTTGMVSRITALLLVAGMALADTPAEDDNWQSMPEVLEAASDSDWRDIEPRNTLYMDLNGGTVVMELAPQFAPAHIANLRKLIDAGHFGKASIKRAQDNYVVQWSGDGALGDAAASLQPEFFRDANHLDFTPLPGRDAYANETGWSNGFPVGRDGPDGRAWLAHCYGMLGAGRDTAADSGNAAELYVVTGHAPRHLDRNVTLMGRVIDGIELLSSLPRGGGPLGFYEDVTAYRPIRSLRFGTDYDPAWQALRTDTDTFAALLRSRQYRNEDWFVDPTGAIELCNVPLPVRRVN